MRLNAGIVGVAAFGLFAGFLLTSRNASASAVQAPRNYSAGDYSPVVDEAAAGAQVADNSFLSGVTNDALAAVGLAEPRGIRNKNPLNIRHNPDNKWVGQIGIDDKGFCIFDTVLNGIRAAAKILKTYSNNNAKTIRQIITKWTSGDLPSIQSNYVNYVSSRLGISPDVALSTNNWAALLQAMGYFENGKEAFTFDDYVAGVRAAGV